MPSVHDIEAFLYQLAPHELALEEDNVGHQVGPSEKEVTKVLVALDITEQVVAEAVAGEYDLIVSHHPLIYPAAAPLLTVRDTNPRGRMLMELIRRDMSAICMHTNLDAAQGGVNDVLAACLGLRDVEPLGDRYGFGRVGVLAEEMPLSDFLALVKEQLRPNGIRFADGGKPVRKVAVGGGSCGSFVYDGLAAGCDTVVTADVGYHYFMDGAAFGVNLIDAGHFPTEDPVCGMLMEKLAERFPALTIVKSSSHREVIEYYL